MFDGILGKSRETVQRKLSTLLEESGTSVENNVDKPNFIQNISDEIVPPNVAKLLALGPKFVLPTRKIPILHAIADVESVVREVPDEAEADSLRARLVNILQNGVTHPRNLSPQEKIITSWRNETKTFMDEKKDKVIVTSADKGNVTDVMNKDEYEGKMQQLVGDETTYKKIPRDLTNRFQTKNNELITSLVNKGSIDPALKTRYTTYNAVAPRIPIVSFVGSPTYNSAKLVTEILSPFAENELNVRNSLDLVEFLRNKRLPEGYILISLDVIALFTNIPTDLALSEVERRFEEISDHTTMDKKDLLRLIQ
uniref:Reverse transcriptase domain-containing protein n=1 Tax=Lutzomyia longipalpis TaxID=7200 RepID=A0A1B0CFR0_LUTLO